MKLGQRLKSMREQQNISMNMVAKRADIAQSTLSRIESGQQMPTFDVLERIITALGLTLADFFSEDNKNFTVPDNIKDLVTDLKNLRSTQVTLIRNIIAEFSLTNQQLNKATSKDLSSELLDLFTSKNKSLTLAGKPISLEERIQILEALRDILSQEETPTNEDDEVLVASYEGDQLFHLPTPEEAEDIQRAIKAAMEQKRKDQSNNNQSE
ncbi:putative transcriptional regulator, XRE family [Desulforamulus reducens MI-1]|uniref:Putative transcriptional regulator, XRE family n=1 Tax=Desulforamulus reducens (strain ATCC BAA-1160 / DSM 100696 / MI-1) TaxID=349161 RepID=A4J2X2_DESRM|nr:helix-turn-helix transcriptional regulator [Desulforamulus reducens]ABO49425.1 putative transcriptional regulator, XRE family [Desulforamulus reducens MI-1]